MQIGEESEPIEVPIPVHPDRMPIAFPEPAEPEEVPA
jgi:hypothetical protein